MLKNSGGFTLIEAMIFLAISGSMLLITVILFSGYQRSTQFVQATKELESALQDRLNDVTTGTFTENKDIKCVSEPDQVPSVTSTEGDGAQGSNIGCVFLGKAMHFKQDTINIYSIVGNQSATGSKFSDAQPVLIPTVTESIPIGPSLQLRAVYKDGEKTDVQDKSSVLVFASTPNGTGLSTLGTGFNSGIQRVNMFISGLTSSTAFSSKMLENPDDVNDINALNGMLRSDDFSVPQTSKLLYCFEETGRTVGKKLARGLLVDLASNSAGVRLATDVEGANCE